jgi:hypothetical protein
LKVLDDEIASKTKHLKMIKDNHRNVHMASLQASFDKLEHHIDQIYDEFEALFKGN